MLRTDVMTFILDHRKNGKRECFMWDKSGLESYVNWAFVNDYLFYVSDENGPKGVGVAYPIPNKFDGSINCLLPCDTNVDPEKDKDLVIMDLIAVNSKSRKEMVKQFKQRFWNWENQDKYALRYGKPKKLNNNYINKIS